MKSLVKYLQKHLAGEVTAGSDILQAFATDASLVGRRPLGAVYVRDERDIRKTLLFLSQTAIKGKAIPLTIRGGGSDLTGAAVGNGLIMIMPAYLNRLLKVNDRRSLYRFEAGYELGRLEAFLADRGSFLPPAWGLPSAATLGGAVANNASSKYSTKYGLMTDQIQALRVILANGEAVEIAKLSRNKVLKKLTLDTFEGDIYRELDRLFYSEDSPYYYKSSPIFDRKGGETRQLPGYDLAGVCGEDGSLNLIPLFAGSQGTLGVITEVEVRGRPYNKTPQVLLLRCADVKVCPQLIGEIQALEPAAVTMINGGCFAKLREVAPFLLSDFAGLEDSEIVLLVEFDDFSLQRIYKKVKKIEGIADGLGVDCEPIKPIEAGANLDRLRSALGLIIADGSAAGRHVFGGFAGAHIPLGNWVNFYNQARLLFKSHKLEFLALGEIGFNRFSCLPRFNLQTPTARKRLLKFLDDYADLVIRHGGRLSLERQEGALLGRFVQAGAGEEDRQLLETLKKLFDPYNILNPAVKLGAEKVELSKSLRAEPDWDRFHQHLPRLS
ncbi:FAD-binding oxidoreductase [Candidatus Saccharibacteria bacterium]|nr:FAD-binding oxidoreductase [Candidatus Saccharibacteria bacterium]